MKHLTTYVIGLIFGLGISISGMANPAKVINFFDVAGIWDPSLIFVMASAFVVAFVGYRLAFRRPKPVFEATFNVPSSRVIDAKLIGGAVVFGIGWGIAGFCPGGALPALGTLNPSVLVFFAALVAGIFLARMLMQVTTQLKAKSA